MKYARLVNIVLSIALAAAFLSGILLQVFSGMTVFQVMHNLSSVILVLGVILHVIQHKKQRRNKNEK